MKKTLMITTLILCALMLNACSRAWLDDMSFNQTAEFKELKSLAYAYNGRYIIEPKLYDEMSAIDEKRTKAYNVQSAEQRRADKLKAHFGDEYESLQTQYDELFEKGYDDICGGFYFVPFTSKCPGDPRGYVEMAQLYAIKNGAPKMSEFVEKYNEFTTQSEKEEEYEIAANLAKVPQILSNGKAYKCESYIKEDEFGGTLSTIKADIYTDIVQTSGGKGNYSKFKEFLKVSSVCYTHGASFAFGDEILNVPDMLVIISLSAEFEIPINEVNLERFWRIKPYKKEKREYNRSSYLFVDSYFDEKLMKESKVQKVKIFIKGKNGHFERLQMDDKP